MYAVIEACGRQYKLVEGDVVFMERLCAEPGEAVTFDKVLVFSDDGGAVFGTPYVDGARVSGEVLKNGRAKKITVLKYKAKKNYRKKQGHRQPYTKVQITKIARA